MSAISPHRRTLQRQGKELVTWRACSANSRMAEPLLLWQATLAGVSTILSNTYEWQVYWYRRPLVSSSFELVNMQCKYLVT